MNNFIAHILVVDDDDGIRSLVKKYLNENNYLVTTAKSAEDAIEKTSLIKFDLIVLDIMMPGKSGLEFTNEYKNKINTPIIFLLQKVRLMKELRALSQVLMIIYPNHLSQKNLILRINNILNKTKKNNQKRVLNLTT